MKPLLAVFKKEIKSYIDHPMAYILAVVFLVLNNFLFFRAALAQEVASTRPMFGFLPWILLFFISALTMRTWSEESRQKTLEVLISYPVKIWQIVVGKYLATVAFITAVFLLTLIIPLSSSVAGDFDWGVIIAQYLAGFFLILAMVAIGQWASSLSKNQVVAFIISLAVQFALFIVGLEFVLISLPYPIDLIAQQLGILSHYNSLIRGVVDLRDVFYFLSLSFIFLLLAYAWLSRKKMRPRSPRWKKLQTTVALLAAIAVVLNLFGQSFTLRADLSENKLYTLSPATKGVLRDLDDTVRLSYYRSKKLPTQVELVSRDVQDLLNDYKQFGGRNIDLSVKHPDEDEEVLQEAQAAGVAPVQFNVHREDEFTLQEGHHGLVIEYLDESEVIPFITALDDLEYNLTRIITGFRQVEVPRVGYLSDFGGQSLDSFSIFANELRQLYQVEPVTLDIPATEDQDAPVIPEIDTTLDALIIAGPTQNYSNEALARVESFIQSGGKILWLLAGASIDQQSLAGTTVSTGLEPFLQSQGLTINQDIVADLAAHQNITFNNGFINYILPYPYWVIAGTIKHVVAGNIAQITIPWSSSITFDGQNQDTVKPLLTTSQSGVSSLAPFNLNPNSLPDFRSFEQKSQVLGVTVENIQGLDENAAGRWVVFSNRTMLEDQLVQQNPGNASLVLNSIDWLMQNDALLTIRSKSGIASTLVWESKTTQSLVQWGNVVGVPVIVVLFGGFWLWRRRRKIRKSV